MSRPAHFRLLASALSFALIATGCAPRAAAQDSSSGSPTHIRALAVYEYLGSYKKPARSRLIPVAIWDGSQFQPGSLYLADPTPISVEPQTLYELMRNGNGIGQVEVLQAEQLPSGPLTNSALATPELATPWIGLVQFLPNPPTGPKLTLPAYLTAKAKFASTTPHFAYTPPAATGVAGGKTTSNTSGPARQGSSAESGRPTLQQRPQITGPSTSSNTTPSEEGRPTLHQPQNASSATPTLHRRTESQQLSSRQSLASSGRPILTYSTHAASPVADLKQGALTGLPPQMHQLAAISDPDGTTDHSYAWDWPTPGDKTAALHKLEALAIQSLPAPKLPPQAPPQSLLRKPIHLKSNPSPAPALKLTLTHEHFRAFQLDYGSGPIYVFSAQSGAPGVVTTYITLIAQPDFAGGLIPLFKSVTSATLLDYQPRMRLIDAVDATGRGRADLLFELLTRRSRQFALYSVQNSQAQELFHTGQQ